MAFALIIAVLLLLLAFALKNWFLQYLKISRAYNHIPCPPNRLPFLGNILSLPINAHEFSKTLANFYHQIKDSSIGCLWLGTYPILAFFHPVGLETFFASSKNITKSIDYNYLHPWLRTGLLTSSGSKWKNRRRIITPAFHDKELLNNFVDIYNEQTMILLRRLAALPTGKETNLYPYIAACALDIICEAAMGLSVGAQQKKNSQYVEAILKVTDVVLKRQRLPWLWPEFAFRFSSEGREHERCLKTIHGFTGKVIQERANDFQLDQVRTKRRAAFLDLLLRQMHEENLTLTDIQEEVDTFMFEGHDTTAAAMNFTCHAIASHPEVQEKLHEEIDRVFAGDTTRPCTMEDLEELEYLERVIKETLRLFPSVPFIGREVQEDFVHVDGTKILRGTTAAVFIHFLHRDPKHFPDPEKFDPDRFLPENSKGRSPYAYIPFSAGSRNCIGQRFALLEEKVILSWILRRLRLKTHQSVAELRLSFELILRSENDVLVQLQPRN